jgi:hypothetical protein
MNDSSSSILIRLLVLSHSCKTAAKQPNTHVLPFGLLRALVAGEMRQTRTLCRPSHILNELRSYLLRSLLISEEKD